MQQSLNFINNPLTKHVSGTIMPIFKSARPSIAAYGFQHLMLLTEVLGSRDAGSGHWVHTARIPDPQYFNQQRQVLETIGINIRSGIPEEGHNGARNMFS